ncbi:MAG: TonB-dependent receptor [Calditrichia bacterium]
MQANQPYSRAAKLYQILIVTFAFCFVLSTHLQSQETFGNIDGRITDGDGKALTGANVILQGANKGTATDLNGRYNINRVTAGSYTLEVSYIGYQTQTVEISISDGQTTTQDIQLSAAIFDVSEEVVWGIRAKGQAAALTRQKNAANIVNIVAADQMGRFPDGNASEAVQRVPGVALERDQGEGRYIQIRGGSALMSSITFNGERIPSPEDSRQIALDAVPVDILESIEVAKAITPDMDADAIGGSVNLVTKKAPFERLVNLELAGGYNAIRENGGGSGNITLGTRTANDKIGILANASWNRRSLGSDNVEPEYDLGDPGLGDDVLSELQTRLYDIDRTRVGLNTMLDFRHSNQSSNFLNIIYSQSKDEQLRRKFVNADFDDGDVLELEDNWRTEDLSTLNLSGGGDHNLNNGMAINYNVTYVKSREEKPDIQEIVWVQEGLTSFSPSIADPENITANPGSVSGEYEFDKIETETSEINNEDVVAALSFSLPLNIGSTDGKLTFGGKFRTKTKDQQVEVMEYGLVAGDAILGDGFGEDFSLDGFNPGNYPFPGTVTNVDDLQNIVSSFSSRFGELESEKDIEADAEDYEVKERVVAGFGMIELNVSEKFTLIPGVRFEQTNDETQGFEFDSELETTVASPVAEESYGNFFPMMHLRYRATPYTNVRAAYTSAIARPNFYDLVPYRIRDDEDLFIGNAELSPTTSANLDLLVEHYNQSIGVLSGGIFYKRLTDPIFVFVEDNTLGGDTNQPRNGESGNIFGAELAIQQQLRFLPGALNGLGFYGNFTYVDSKLTLPDGREVKLPGQANNILNLALNYEKSGFFAQTSVSYHGDYLMEVGGSEEEDLFIDKHLQIDASASYQLSETFNVFLELVNLNNERFKVFEGVSERPRQLEYYETSGRLGLRFNL